MTQDTHMDEDGVAPVADAPRAAAVRVWPDVVAPPMYENPANGWHDPRLPDFREIWRLAREAGYAVGIHGSLRRDVDLIAAPWTEDAVPAETLINHMATGLNASRLGPVEIKPLGRIAVSLQVDGWVKVIDLSVMPAIGTTPTTPEETE